MDEMNALAPEAVWIEISGRHREATLRQRVSGSVVTLGRAYDNDVVLDDPHVAAHHLRIARAADGRWIAEDLGSINGLFLEGAKNRREQVTLDGSSALRIGHTIVRVRFSGEAVPAELPLLSQRSPWPLALVAIALMLGLELLGLWLNETAEPKLIRYLTPVLTVTAAVAVWTTLWSVLSRVFSGHARFGLHLLIFGGGLLLYSLYDQLAEFGAFALSWTALARYQYVVAWLIFGAVCFLHLRAVNRLRLPLKALAAVVLAALGITMQTLKMSDLRSTYGQASILQRLQPPSIRIASAQAEAAFFTEAQTLQARLDKARSEEPSDGETTADEGD